MKRDYLYVIPKHRHSLIFIVGAILLSILLGSCADEILISNNKGDVDLQFQVQTLKSLPPRGMTKSGAIATEDLIDNIQVLVFENDKYKYTVQGLQVTNSGNGSTSFNARISSSNQPVKLFLIANAKTEVANNPPVLDESVAVVKLRFKRALTTIGITGNLPMWGSYDLPSGIDATATNNISGIKMLRSLARVDIVNSNAVPFKLATIQAFRVADNMQIVPNAVTPTPQVTEPSIPTGVNNTVNIQQVATTSENNSIAQLYLPESAAVGSGDENLATCIVIGGYYNNNPTISYYRLDFKPGIAGHPFGQILRNYRYEFNLTRIIQNGYSSAQAAADGEPSGIANIILWQDYIHNIVFNSSAFFGISTNHITLAGINSSETLLTETDVANYTICWANSMGVPQGMPSGTTIENEYFKVEKVAGGATINITAIQENPTGSEVRYIRYVLIEAQNLHMLLTIIQEPDEFMPGDAKWAPTNVDQPGVFAEKIQDRGMMYQWNRRVGWASTGTITGWNAQGADGNMWEDATDPCPKGWRVPTSDELKGLIDESPGWIWRSIYAGYEISGVWFAPTQAEAEAATFEAPGAAIFMPAVGQRSLTGDLSNQESNGYYWADNLDIAANPYWLSLVDGTFELLPSHGRASGASVRCVRADN